MLKMVNKITIVTTNYKLMTNTSLVRSCICD